MAPHGTEAGINDEKEGGSFKNIISMHCKCVGESECVTSTRT